MDSSDFSGSYTRSERANSAGWSGQSTSPRLNTQAVYGIDDLRLIISSHANGDVTLQNLPDSFVGPWLQYMMAMGAVGQLASSLEQDASFVLERLSRRPPFDGMMSQIVSCFITADTIKAQVAQSAGFTAKRDTYDSLIDKYRKWLQEWQEGQSARRQEAAPLPESWSLCSRKLFVALESALGLASRQQKSCESLLRCSTIPENTAAQRVDAALHLRERDYVSYLMLRLLDMEGDSQELYKELADGYEGVLLDAGYLSREIPQPPLWGLDDVETSDAQLCLISRRRQLDTEQDMGCVRSSPPLSSQSHDSHYSPSSQLSQTSHAWRSPPPASQPFHHAYQSSQLSSSQGTDTSAEISEKFSSASYPSATSSMHQHSPNPQQSDAMEYEVTGQQLHSAQPIDSHAIVADPQADHPWSSRRPELHQTVHTWLDKALDDIIEGEKEKSSESGENSSETRHSPPSWRMQNNDHDTRRRGNQGQGWSRRNRRHWR